MKITIGHTHDADDAFMFYAMLNGKISTQKINIKDKLEPIAELNLKALKAHYDMTAVSVAMLPAIADDYDLLTVGACMAETRGPILIAKSGAILNSIAVPAINTTACYTARLFAPNALFIEHPYADILTAVNSDQFDAGVIITEEQMLLDEYNLEFTDLGAWWQQCHGLPLPLGVDVIRASLPLAVKQHVCQVFQSSIKYALEHETEAIPYALNFGRGIANDKGRDFVRTFVNQYTVNLGDRGIKAIRFFLNRCHKYGLISQLPQLDFISPT
jgi:1,4-dihydroxy-6-naphthoate synthase